MSTYLTLLEPIGAEVQMSSPLGENLRAAGLRIGDGGAPDFPPSLVERLGSQIPLSSPVGQFLRRWAKAVEDGDTGALPGLRARIPQLKSQIGEGPLLTYFRQVLAVDVG